jgi:rhodanese-related sulfurtransferase
MLVAAYGLVTQQPYVHFALAALGILPFWFPAWHPVDRFYNAVIRPLWKGVNLPPGPLPRRIACLMGGSMNLGIGLAFYSGNPILAYLFGVILVPLQLIVISTHFCVASWMYEGLLRIIGKWDAPIPAERARELVEQDGHLIDVREPDDFARGHLPGAINIPLNQIGRHVGQIKEKSAVLYCQSGLRCQQAVQALKRQGCDQVYTLGAMTRWGKTANSEPG